MTKRAYEELKPANRGALGLSREEHGDERQAPFAMNATNSTDMCAPSKHEGPKGLIS